MIASTRRYSLCVLAIAKNEGMIIKEWIDHYLWQGVEHFYIIDNGSTDNMSQVLEPYIQKGLVSLYKLEGRKQVQHYNTVYNKYIKKHTDWLLVCDIDEYVYHRQKGKTLKSFVKAVNRNHVASITLHWKMFGSSGYHQQPKQLRKAFVWRKRDIDTNVKQIVNTKYVVSLDIHKHKMKQGPVNIVNPKELALNHYPIMSKEYFEKIKMTRGDGSTDQQSYQTLRNWNYFKQYDHYELYDDELSTLVPKCQKI
jgi:glycosyltransferase involved in cell wall biosynthesis